MKGVFFFTALLLCVFSATFAQKSLTNVALNASVSASSKERPAWAAVDGDHTSYWQSGSFVGTHWLKLNNVHSDSLIIPLRLCAFA